MAARRIRRQAAAMIREANGAGARGRMAPGPPKQGGNVRRSRLSPCPILPLVHPAAPHASQWRARGGEARGEPAARKRDSEGRQRGGEVQQNVPILFSGRWRRRRLFSPKRQNLALSPPGPIGALSSGPGTLACVRPILRVQAPRRTARATPPPAVPPSPFPFRTGPSFCSSSYAGTPGTVALSAVAGAAARTTDRRARVDRPGSAAARAGAERGRGRG